MAKHTIGLRLDDRAYDLLSQWAMRHKRTKANAAEMIISSFVEMDSAMPCSHATSAGEQLRLFESESENAS